MSEKDLYRQKKQAQLDEWKADLDKLKAKAEGVSADTKLKMKEQIETIKSEIKKAETKLNELAGAGEDAWGLIKEGVESAWGSLKTAFNDATSKFKD